MPRTVNQNDNPTWYDLNKLRAEFMWQGHDNYGVQAARILGVSPAVARRKINHAILEHEDTIALARALHMSKEMYCMVFLKDVYNEEDAPE